MPAAALAPEPVTAFSVLALVQSIEARSADAPTAAAFRSALTRRGREAFEIGGADTIDRLARAIADADPAKAEARSAILAQAWGERLGATGGRTRP